MSFLLLIGPVVRITTVVRFCRRASASLPPSSPHLSLPFLPPPGTQERQSSDEEDTASEVLSQVPVPPLPSSPLGSIPNIPRPVGHDSLTPSPVCLPTRRYILHTTCLPSIVLVFWDSTHPSSISVHTSYPLPPCAPTPLAARRTAGQAIIPRGVETARRTRIQ